VVDPILNPTAYADDPPVSYRDVERVAVGVQQRSRLDPGVDVLLGVRRTRPPWFGDPVDFDRDIPSTLR
jgi:hypothetical protein